MLSVFSSLKSFLKLSTVSTTGFVFRLHCKATVLFLVCASILVTCRQYFGDPIHCLQSDFKKIEFLEKFCWIHSTFILPDAWDLPIGTHVPHPGVDKVLPGRLRKYQAYYQWVAFVLLVQSILFYIPHYLWKVWERGTIKDLTLNLKLPVLPPDECTKSYKLLCHVLRIHWGHFTGYYEKYIFCELLTLINVIGQMFLLDKFLGGAFSNFGIKVLQWSEWDQHYRTDPLVQAFPRMTKCRFHDTGLTGDIQNIDAMCLLPLNILNEKIFIFLWFWMVLLCSSTVMVMIYRVMIYTVPQLRYLILIVRAPLTNKGALDRVVGASKPSDWFVLYLLSKNIDPQHYRCVINQLAAEIEHKNGYAIQNP